MDYSEKHKRDYDYQKKYLKRMSVWFNTKNDSDMELLDWLNHYYDGMSKSEGVKICIYKCMKADQEKNHGKEGK